MQPFTLNHEADSFVRPFQGWMEAGFTTGFYEDGRAGHLAYQDPFLPEEIDRNRRDFCAQLGLQKDAFRAMKQCHSDRSLILHNKKDSFNLCGQNAPEGDALITAEPGLLLSVFSADCVPLLMWDSKKRVVAAVHGGWRGTLSAIGVKTLDKMRTHFQSDIEDIYAYIGPAIGPCCYETGREVYAAYKKKFSFYKEVAAIRNGACFLDLKETHRRSLMEMGIEENRIGISEECTFCGSRELPSYRKSGASAGRFSAFIFIKT